MARGVLAVPVVVASPAQGGVVTATGGTIQPFPWGSDYNSEYQNYVYSATPAQGWTCTGFDVVAVETLKGSGLQPVTNTLTAHYAGVESGRSTLRSMSAMLAAGSTGTSTRPWTAGGISTP